MIFFFLREIDRFRTDVDHYSQEKFKQCVMRAEVQVDERNVWQIAFFELSGIAH